MDMRFDTEDVRGLRRAGSLLAGAREIWIYMLDSLGVQ
jgi:hypothetical protein